MVPRAASYLKMGKLQYDRCLNEISQSEGQIAKCLIWNICTGLD